MSLCFVASTTNNNNSGGFVVVIIIAIAILAMIPVAISDSNATEHTSDTGVKNPSLTIEEIIVDAAEFNRVLRVAPIQELEKSHIISWQATIDNNLVYANPNGNAVIRFYDVESKDEFVEVGMGANPDNKFWVAVQTPDEGYVVIHSDLERGWYPQAKVVVSYTERAGMTVNNGARIVVSNLDIGLFAPESYSTYGMESTTDPPAALSGTVLVEFLSGDPSQNVFALFPFYVAAGIGIIVGVLFITKKR